MDDRDAIRRGYDRLAERYAERTAASERDGTVLAAFLDSLADPVGLLDVGCGHGDPALRRLAGTSADRVLGLDFSRSQLALAREAVPRADPVQGDMARLPVRTDAVDAVTAVGAIIHVPLSDHRRVVDEFARVLRPGGRLLLSEGATELERTTDDWLGAGAEMTWHMAGPATTREQLRDAGFSLTREWDPPDPDPETGPEPPYFAARLVE